MSHSRRLHLSSSGLVLCFWLACTALTIEPLYGAVAPGIEPSWFVDMQRFADSAHGALSCDTCHEEKIDREPPHPNPENPGFLKGKATLTYDYSRCSDCHRFSFEAYLQGKHSEARKREVEGERREEEGMGQEIRRAPTCGDCHPAHYIEVDLPRVESGRAMTGICGSCHQAQIAGYLKNYHGKAAVKQGNPKAAYCTDCHGDHEIVSLKEKEAALTACRLCHPDAQEDFADVAIHPTIKDLTDKEKRLRVAAIRVVAALSAVMLTLVVGLFWILRVFHEKLRRRPW